MGFSKWNYPKLKMKLEVQKEIVSFSTFFLEKKGGAKNSSAINTNQSGQASCIRMIARGKQSDFLKQVQVPAILIAQVSLGAELLHLSHIHTLDYKQEQ